MRVVVSGCLVLLFLGSCAPKKTVVVEVPVPEAPPVERVLVADLSVEPNHEQLDLSWRKAGKGLIAGYNVYISERPLAAAFPGTNMDPSIQPYNTTPFPGDTIPHDGVEHFEADRLDNGVRYFVTVRVVYPDQTLSAPTNEVVAVCGARGEAELAVRHSGGPDGFSFARNGYVACDDKASDLYFYTKEGHDFLASPNRLDAFIKKTGFIVLSWKGAYRDIVDHLSETRTLTATDQVEVSSGDWVLLRCAGGTHALVNVKRIEGSGEQRQVTISFAWSSLVDELFF